MCGIVGIVGIDSVNQAIYDSLLVLQHRGQDAAGIVTLDKDNRFKLCKANGLVRNIFDEESMRCLQGHLGIGHVRYPTAGTSSISEAQPFYVNYPYGIVLAHNGNLTNADEIRSVIFEEGKRHINTDSDSEILLNMFAITLASYSGNHLSKEDIFGAVTKLHHKLRGAYACVAMIIGHGMVAFRDPYGIRPLVLGQRVYADGRKEYMVASESVALSSLGFQFIRDVAAGEALYITEAGELFAQQCAAHSRAVPCIFEYIYFARADSTLNGISVYQARIDMGKRLGNKILRQWSYLDIDVVIPIPETSCDAALEIARVLNKPYRQGFVKNRYVGRTFIMPGQSERVRSVRRKLNPNPIEFAGKNVLLVDDSIVRGTTSKQIVEIARSVGAQKVYLASAAPEIRYPNVYGIDMPTANELIAYNRNLEQIRAIIGADALIFQDLADLIAALKDINPAISQFDCSVFDGHYITQDISQEYLIKLHQLRRDKNKNKNSLKGENLEIYNACSRL